jgi:hypothetical protein
MAVTNSYIMPGLHTKELYSTIYATYVFSGPSYVSCTSLVNSSGSATSFPSPSSASFLGRLASHWTSDATSTHTR